MRRAVGPQGERSRGAGWSLGSGTHCSLHRVPVQNGGGETCLPGRVCGPNGTNCTEVLHVFPSTESPVHSKVMMIIYNPECRPTRRAGCLPKELVREKSAA